MKHNHQLFEAAMAAAVGDEPALTIDLADAFLAGAAIHRALLGSRPGTEAWRETAARLEGLAASFDAPDLMRAAAAARLGRPNDPALIAAIDRALALSC